MDSRKDGREGEKESRERRERDSGDERGRGRERGTGGEERKGALERGFAKKRGAAGIIVQRGFKGQDGFGKTAKRNDALKTGIHKGL